MFPISDHIPSERFPIVNVTIMAACSFVFYLQLSLGEADSLIKEYDMILARVTNPQSEIEIVHQIPVRTPFGNQIQEQRRVALPPTVPP